MFLGVFWIGLEFAVLVCAMKECNPSNGLGGTKAFSDGLHVVRTAGIITMVYIFTMARTMGALATATRLVSDSLIRLNRTKAQSRRRNRAYVVDFRLFMAGEPAGRVQFRESESPSCQSTAGVDTSELTLVKDLPFGRTEVAEYSGAKEADVGLRGWKLGTSAERRDRLVLCIGPDGATSLISGESVEPINGRLTLLVQGFERSPGQWRAFGPARRIEMTFAGSARLAVD